MLSAAEKKRLEAKARELREKIVEVTFACGGTHIGGAGCLRSQERSRSTTYAGCSLLWSFKWLATDLRT